MEEEADATTEADAAAADADDAKTDSNADSNVKVVGGDNQEPVDNVSTGSSTPLLTSPPTSSNANDTLNLDADETVAIMTETVEPKDKDTDATSASTTTTTTTTTPPAPEPESEPPTTSSTNAPALVDDTPTVNTIVDDPTSTTKSSPTTPPVKKPIAKTTTDPAPDASSEPSNQNEPDDTNLATPTTPSNQAADPETNTNVGTNDNADASTSGGDANVVASVGGSTENVDDSSQLESNVTQTGQVDPLDTTNLADPTEIDVKEKQQPPASSAPPPPPPSTPTKPLKPAAPVASTPKKQPPVPKTPVLVPEPEPESPEGDLTFVFEDNSSNENQTLPDSDDQLTSPLDDKLRPAKILPTTTDVAGGVPSAPSSSSTSSNETIEEPSLATVDDLSSKHVKPDENERNNGNNATNSNDRSNEPPEAVGDDSDNDFDENSNTAGDEDETDAKNKPPPSLDTNTNASKTNNATRGDDSGSSSSSSSSSTVVTPVPNPNDRPGKVEEPVTPNVIEKVPNLCRFAELSTRLHQPDTLIVEFNMLNDERDEAECVAPDYIELEVSSNSINTYTNDRDSSCIFSHILASSELSSVSSITPLSKGLRTMTIRFEESLGQGLIPGLGYHTRVHLCQEIPDKNDPAGTECRYLTGIDTFMKPKPMSTPNLFGVRFVVPFINRIATIDTLEIEMDKRQAVTMEDVAKEIEMSLFEELRTDRTSSVQAVEAERIIATIAFTRSRPYLQLDVLPPRPTSSSSYVSTSPLSATLLAERLRCILGLRGLSSSSDRTTPTPSSSSFLSIIDGVFLTNLIDPCHDNKSNMCERIQIKTSKSSPTTSITQEPTTTPTPTGNGNLPRNPANDDYPVENDYEPTDSTEMTDSTQQQQQPSAVGDDSDFTEDFGTSIGELTTTNSKPVDESEWYDSFSINPFYLMVIVGSLFTITFWALCMRGNSDSAPRTTSAEDGDEDLDDLELGGGGGGIDGTGGVEMATARGTKSLGNQKGFSSLSNVDEDALHASMSSSSTASSSTNAGGSVSSGSFSNAREDGSASKFLISVLISLGLPSFGTTKYCSILKDNYLNTLEQLKQLDTSDWKRLGLPLVIEEALRKALQEHENKEGRFAQGGGTGGGQGEKRAKGLDLKAAKKSQATNKETSHNNTNTHNTDTMDHIAHVRPSMSYDSRSFANSINIPSFSSFRVFPFSLSLSRI